MFAQVASFKSKKNRRKHIESEVTIFRNAIRLEGISIKQELVLHSRNHDTWLAIALFESKEELDKIVDKIAEHQNATNLLKNLEPHLKGKIQLFEAEVF